MNLGDFERYNVQKVIHVCVKFFFFFISLIMELKLVSSVKTYFLSNAKFKCPKDG